MRHRRFVFEENRPFFRPPKYTGVTLSLLSIFVLVSMLAVWEKMYQLPDLKTIRVLAWESCQTPLEEAQRAFQKDNPCFFDITYFHTSEFETKAGSISKPVPEVYHLILCPDLEICNKYLINQKYLNLGPTAYYDSSLPGVKISEPNESVAFNAWRSPSPKNESDVLSFVRYIKAPTRGQVHFAIEGWTGVSDDHWSPAPTLKMYADEDCKGWVSPILSHFGQVTGINVESSYLSHANLVSSLHILSKANQKNYLPDLVCFSELQTAPPWLDEYFPNTTILNGPKKVYLRKGSPLLKTMQKVMNSVSEKK
jgi:hypothetical protein